MATPALLVLSAMPVELRRICRSLSLRPALVAGIPTYHGAAGPTPVVAAAVGVGPATSRRNTEALLQALPVSRVIVLGIAGGVAATPPIGSVVTPELVIDDSTGATFCPEFPPGVPVAGTLLTGAAIATGTDAGRLRARRVTAVDMETAAIAAACHPRGLPWSAYRAISDILDANLLDHAVFAAIRPDGRLDPVALLRIAARRPRSLPRLTRLGLDADRAIRAATRAVLSDLTVTPEPDRPGGPAGHDGPIHPGGPGGLSG